MGSKEDKFNKKATSKEGEGGRLQQRSQPSCYFLSPHQAPSCPHRLSTGSSYKRKNTPRYKADSVLAEAQAAIRFWGSFHKYFNHLLTGSRRTEFSLPSQVIRHAHREATYTGSGPSSHFQMGKLRLRERKELTQNHPSRWQC